MYYILEYNYSAVGGVKGSVKRDLHPDITELKRAIYDAQTNMRCSNLQVVELQAISSYEPVVEFVLSKKESTS